MKAKIVIGLGFGDEGKGITTDYLCSKNNKPIAIRFSGGQQAAHTVMIGDLKHIHSSFSSGALRGHPTYIAEQCTIHPTYLYNELEVLQEKGGCTELYIHPLCKVTTPFDVWYNRKDSINLEHGTCGKGIGATMKRNESQFKLYAIDLLAPESFLIEKLKAIAAFYGFEKNNFLKEELNLFLNCVKKINWNIVGYEFLESYKTLIFEGSQGILLDMNHGIFPNVTYANTTSKNAIKICNHLSINDIEIFYVTRSYATRHGHGWMINEEDIYLTNNEEETCLFNEFQKGLRLGKLNSSLLIHAFNIDKIYSPKSKNNLVISCMDQYSPELDFKKLKKTFSNIYGSFSPDSKSFKQLNY